ncbi:DUF3488 and transglutaminase-like domain-containing protein [Yinghuangia sp. YIM S10712]|uniref:DUF3488 and transglutaminase-like domain-containing protein n=1 Tax=Yinghuangia sp. YIM S10712 TaxID=3436930 RepID=UPI003F530A57
MLLAAFVGLMFHRVFGLTTVLAPTVVAAVVPAIVVGAACRGMRAPAPVSATVTVNLVAAVVAGSAVYARDRALAAVVPTPGSVAAMAGDLADVPREILTTVLPAPPGTSSILVPACVWVASAAGAELLYRTRFAALAVLPATALFLGAALLATGAPGTSLPLVAGFAAAVGLFLAVRDTAPRPANIALAGLLALALAIPGAFAALSLPGGARHAFDPRGHVDPPAPTTLRGPSPLAYVSAWLQHPETLMFTDAGSPPPPGGKLYRLAVFDHYDGVSWTPVDRFLPSGGRVPESERDAAGTPVGQDITVAELPGVFLPAVERPVEVHATEGEFAVDPESGVLASETPLRTGMRYQVTSRPTEHDPARTEYMAAGRTASALELPGGDESGAAPPVVAALRDYAQQATAGAQFPYQQALRLASWLRGYAAGDPQAIPGHSYRHIQYFLETSRQGTSEQFATAFALMARTLALPARVVVGFRAEAQQAEPVTRVRGGDVLVWAEVEFAGAGWVPFFPTPGAGSATSAVAPPTEEVAEPEPVPAEPASPGAPTGPPSRAEIDSAIENRAHAAATEDHAGGRDTGVGAGVVVSAVVSAALAGYVALAFAGPVWLRRSRARGTPEMRIAGSWEQLVDDLARIGPPLPAGATTGDVVEHARVGAGTEAGASAAVVASAADGVAFGGVAASETLADECVRHGRLVRTRIKAASAGDRRGRFVRLAGRLRPRAVARVLAAARGSRGPRGNIPGGLRKKAVGASA